MKKNAKLRVTIPEWMRTDDTLAQVLLEMFRYSGLIDRVAGFPWVFEYTVLATAASSDQARWLSFNVSAEVIY